MNTDDINNDNDEDDGRPGSANNITDTRSDNDATSSPTSVLLECSSGGTIPSNGEASNQQQQERSSTTGDDIDGKQKENDESSEHNDDDDDELSYDELIHASQSQIEVDSLSYRRNKGRSSNNSNHNRRRVRVEIVSTPHSPILEEILTRKAFIAGTQKTLNQTTTTTSNSASQKNTLNNNKNRDGQTIGTPAAVKIEDPGSIIIPLNNKQNSRIKISPDKDNLEYEASSLEESTTTASEQPQPPQVNNASTPAPAEGEEEKPDVTDSSFSCLDDSFVWSLSDICSASASTTAGGQQQEKTPRVRIDYGRSGDVTTSTTSIEEEEDEDKIVEEAPFRNRGRTKNPNAQARHLQDLRYGTTFHWAPQNFEGSILQTTKSFGDDYREEEFLYDDEYDGEGGPHDGHNLPILDFFLSNGYMLQGINCASMVHCDSDPYVGCFPFSSGSSASTLYQSPRLNASASSSNEVSKASKKTFEGGNSSSTANTKTNNHNKKQKNAPRKQRFLPDEYYDSDPTHRKFTHRRPRRAIISPESFHNSTTTISNSFSSVSSYHHQRNHHGHSPHRRFSHYLDSSRLDLDLSNDMQVDLFVEEMKYMKMDIIWHPARITSGSTNALGESISLADEVDNHSSSNNSNNNIPIATAAAAAQSPFLNNNNKNKKLKRPMRSRGWIEMGSILPNIIIHPKFMWKAAYEPNLYRKKINEVSPYSIDLLDIVGIHSFHNKNNNKTSYYNNSSSSRIINREKYPFAQTYKCFKITTVSNQMYVFEAPTVQLRDKLVTGLKLIVARLASKVLVAGEVAEEEFFSPVRKHVHDPWWMNDEEEGINGGNSEEQQQQKECFQTEDVVQSLNRVSGGGGER
eukprot:CAMPEP_0178962778 /NCGR_PEP_ID=MMETSP0789-20121207/14581_1 /TAXON_ID=3005 /ORGANISM="Rhizosolenia setigera, Strain CCMP 1694" /LENGTH=855 /DNA_ID=CAMNT_0020647021 /DNA_START=101 /DNA_END=2668 /DNA_ORIENTATION=-